MSFIQAIESLAEKEARQKATREAPKDFQPRVDVDADGYGSVTMVSDQPGLRPGDSFIDDFLRDRGFDPEHVFIPRNTFRISQWQTYDERWLYSYKYEVAPRIFDTKSFGDIQDRLWISPAPEVDHDPAPRVVMISDAHIGKSAMAGGGSDIIQERWKNGVIKALSGSPVQDLNLVFGGDLIEGYESQGGKNIIQCDLTLTEQIRTAVSLVAWTISTSMQHAQTITISACQGNHGDSTRAAGVSITDSHDLMIVKLGYDMLQEKFGEDFTSRVSLMLPEDNEAAVSYPFGGTQITLTHGHVMRGAQGKGLENWWKSQTFSGLSPKDSSITLAGHYHNVEIKNVAQDRFYIFAPSLETKSSWIQNSGGVSANSGVLCFDVIDKLPQRISIL